MILSALKRLPFVRNYTSSQWSKWWAKRPIDWGKEYFTPDHLHRNIIVAILKSIPWFSLFEVGCGAGANLAKIIHHIPGKQLGGVDINPEAIKVASEKMTGGHFKVGNMDDILMSDNSVDVVLTDMSLIYAGKIDKVLGEIKRIARNYIVLCELSSSKWYERWWIFLTSGLHMYNYPKLLQKYGFYNIIAYKIPKEAWSSDKQIRYGYVLLAKVPRRK